MKDYLLLVSGFVLAAGLLLINDLFFFESIVVTSSSMEPTLFPNERIFLRKVGYSKVERFDVVVIKSGKVGHRIVKRVIGLPGDCVQLLEGWKVQVGDQVMSYSSAGLDEPIMTESGSHLIQLKANPVIHYETVYGKDRLCLASDEYYLLGDNRLASGDSRYFGVFKRPEIVGRLTRIWYSYDILLRGLRTSRLGQAVN